MIILLFFVISAVICSNQAKKSADWVKKSEEVIIVFVWLHEWKEGLLQERLLQEAGIC